MNSRHRKLALDISDTSDSPQHTLSLVRGDLLFRIQQRIGLIPAHGLGVGRRAVFYALVACLPIAAWALVTGRAGSGNLDESLLEHFGVHVRCLIAIPLLVVAEGMAHAVTQRLMPQFVRAGLIGDRSSFVTVLREVARMRDRTLPWVLIGGLVLAWTLAVPATQQLHELRWAADATRPGELGFGGWWYLYVARLIYITLVLAWLWRLVLLFELCRRLTRLDLALVPTHPDRLGGLGFLESVPGAFAAVIFALSAVISSGWAHDVVYHSQDLMALRLRAVAFLVLVTVVFLAPLAVFKPLLARTKRTAVLEYAALVAAHGRAVRTRWIERKTPADTALLAAPEIGPVADTLALYQAVANMRTLPVGKRAITAVLVPAVLPMLVVVALQVPIGKLVVTILKALT